MINESELGRLQFSCERVSAVSFLRAVLGLHYLLLACAVTWIMGILGLFAFAYVVRLIEFPECLARLPYLHPVWLAGGLVFVLACAAFVVGRLGDDHLRFHENGLSLKLQPFASSGLAVPFAGISELVVDEATWSLLCTVPAEPQAQPYHPSLLLRLSGGQVIDLTTALWRFRIADVAGFLQLFRREQPDLLRIALSAQEGD
ncbi:hypothetical protein ACFL59_09330 [Planctomycetota bacterium]